MFQEFRGVFQALLGPVLAKDRRKCGHENPTRTHPRKELVTHVQGGPVAVLVDDRIIEAQNNHIQLRHLVDLAGAHPGPHRGEGHEVGEVLGTAFRVFVTLIKL